MIAKEIIGTALPCVWRNALDANIIEMEESTGTTYKVSEVLRAAILLFMLIDLEDKPKWIEAGRELNKDREFVKLP